MGREDAGRWLDVLDESFGAAIAAADDIAADDLALSFLQDLELAEALRRVGAIAAQTGPDPFCAVIEVGADYAVIRAAQPKILKLDSTVFKTDPKGSRPVCVDRSLVGLLRNLARRRMLLRLTLEGGASEGLLVRAGRDHLGLIMGDREVLVPLSLVTSLTLTEEQKWRF